MVTNEGFDPAAYVTSMPYTVEGVDLAAFYGRDNIQTMTQAASGLLSLDIDAYARTLSDNPNPTEPAGWQIQG